MDLDLQERIKKKQLEIHNYNQDIFKGEIKMATKKTAAEECCAKCESDIAALKKEIAALKKELKAKSSGGSDPRVDTLIKVVKRLNAGVAKKFGF